MKHLRFQILNLVFLSIILFTRCGGDIKGTFYISEEALKYQFDTTIASFQMQDNHGITDEFFKNGNFYNTHRYFSEWGTKGEAYGETYGVAYNSVVNNFYFSFVLRADVDYTTVDVEWNFTDMLSFKFETKEVTYGTKPAIHFYDSILVKNKTYYNILEIDYTDKLDKIDDYTPVKTYIAGNVGLVKFILKQDIVFERISN